MKVEELEKQFRLDLKNFLEKWDVPDKFEVMLMEYVVDDFFEVLREEKKKVEDDKV